MKTKKKIQKERIDMTIAPATKRKLEKLAYRRKLSMGSIVEALIKAEKVYVK